MTATRKRTALLLSAIATIFIIIFYLAPYIIDTLTDLSDNNQAKNDGSTDTIEQERIVFESLDAAATESDSKVLEITSKIVTYEDFTASNNNPEFTKISSIIINKVISEEGFGEGLKYMEFALSSGNIDIYGIGSLCYLEVENDTQKNTCVQMVTDALNKTSAQTNVSDVELRYTQNEN